MRHKEIFARFVDKDARIVIDLFSRAVVEMQNYFQAARIEFAERRVNLVHSTVVQRYVRYIPFDDRGESKFAVLFRIVRVKRRVRPTVRIRSGGDRVGIPRDRA